MSNPIENPGDPEILKSSPHLDDRLNEAIKESEIAGGLDLESLPTGKRVEVWIENGERFVVEKREDGYYLSGHEEFCPKPTRVVWIGSVWGSSTSIKNNFIGRGMNLQFRLPWQENKPVEGDPDLVAQPHIQTPPIEDIRELTAEDDEAILKEYEREAAEGVEEIRREKSDD
ncbi:MAG: hypothetical protein A2831_01820 [Candidatus Yanofskybacteria bacterium RIFCSPHIGHO2_01_FULL_44_17]|uniref:Uncharacterized protein n=1 Tax=Candidatus Yanofskybacteria bacterium RIFCSPHIGHO2_01_FULL_44_17 TaxID=1802668 RepID=A0A1F8EV78_9BACT|nr:MAG: hypothetical protein A2831_01820 [Candidatus Yanofskybacteria bacterium RIFCSPHIGHO2_01_FULL_44_17]